MEVVLFPDAALLFVDYLTAELAARSDDAVAVRDVPNPRPPRFVTVHLGGGVRQTIITDRPTLLVECWASTAAEAHDLAQLCRGLVNALAGTTQAGTTIYRVDELGGPVDLPDPVSNQPRFTFSVQAHLRGATE